MHCTQCSAELASESRFCHRCGAAVAGATEAAAPREQFLAAASALGDDDDPETELWQGSFSKFAMVGHWIAAAVATVGLLVLAATTSIGWTIPLSSIALVWLGLAAMLFYRQLSVHYYLTNQRFVHEKGLLWREINRIEAIDIDDVSFQQGPVERMFGVGTIEIRSSDASHPQVLLPGVERVREVAGMIDEVRRQERRKRGLHIESI
jgi:membrane protein YdbS with pleckstrin-like domain